MQEVRENVQANKPKEEANIGIVETEMNESSQSDEREELMEESEEMQSPKLFPFKGRVFDFLNRILTSIYSQWSHIALFWLFLIVTYILLSLVFVDRIWLKEGEDKSFFETSCIILGVMSGMLTLAYIGWKMTTNDRTQEREELSGYFHSVKLIDYGMMTFVGVLVTVLYFPLIALFLIISITKSPEPSCFLEIYSIIFLVLESFYSLYMYYYYIVVWVQDIEKIRQLRFDLEVRYLEEGNALTATQFEGPPLYSALIQENEASPPSYSQLIVKD